MIDEYRAGIEQAVEVISDWLKGNEQPLSWNPPQYAPMWTWCLAANLAAAAGLCHAFDLGQNPRSLGPMRLVHVLPSGTKVWEPAGDWRPGCGREVPGCGRSAP